MTGISMWTPIYTLYDGRILRPQKTWIFDLGYTKITKNFFVSFRFFVLFCVIFGFLLQNFFSTKTSYFFLSFDCISVKISSKLRKLQKNEKLRFLFPSTVAILNKYGYLKMQKFLLMYSCFRRYF